MRDQSLKNILLTLVLGVLAIAGGTRADAFTLDKYASSSALASGKWVKVSVEQSGIHLLSEQTLRGWGFTNPSQVRVYGYGARKLSDNLSASTFYDDLPQAFSEWVDGKGLFFYAEGPVGMQTTSGNYTKPVQNYYTTEGYYYLSDSRPDDAVRVPQKGNTTPGSVTTPYDTFLDFVYHEQELYSPGEAGLQLVGEDFKFTRDQQFTLTLTDPVADSDAYMEASFLARTGSGSVTFGITANGTSVINKSFSAVTSEHTHARQETAQATFKIDGTKQLNLRVSVKSASSLLLANLDYIGLRYERHLTLGSNAAQLPFEMKRANRGVRLSGATASTRVWDVTSPAAVTLVDAEATDGTLVWTARNTDTRQYIAFTPSAGKFPVPKLKGTVANQNLHGIADTPDMIIIAPRQWSDQAERLAEYRRQSADSLKVLVLDADEIYNEFSSGTPHVQGLRKCLKMFYDRGMAAGNAPRFALMMGRVFYDNRLLTATGRSLGYPILPGWFSERGLSDTESYTTDDMLAFLEDGSGSNMGNDKLSLALGRLPVTSRADAEQAVTKIINYETDAPSGTWKNNMLTLADDQDSAVHMKQSDAMWNALLKSEHGGDAFYRKIYTDQYELVSNVYTQARTEFYRALDEGILWWNYIGHASPTSLTAEGVVTYTDLNGLYLRHLPVIYAATCDFMRWDSGTVSGAEILFKNSDGGVIGAISATRPVFITENGYLSESMGREIMLRDDSGKLRPLGEIYRQAKNNFSKDKPVSDTNKLRYVLLGDPAMRLAMPALRLVVDEINGAEVADPDDDSKDPTIIMARQRVTIKGHIENSRGEALTDFTGQVNSVLYDADRSITTLGNGEKGEPYAFDTHGGRLHMGSDSIVNGVFTINIPMPAEVADNFRTATLNIYARSTDGREGAGVDRRFYVYGSDPDAEEDKLPPVIESMYLNHPSFRDGKTVNQSPMLLARVSDNRAINLSTSGVGHQMCLILDGSRTYTDVANFYTPFADGAPGGDIAYQFDNLAPGLHTLKLRVWDTAPNSAEAELSFVVESDLAPSIHEVYTDANPARDHANFFVTHDRPDQSTTVTIEVYDMMGRPVWSSTRTGRSDMFESAPIAWDLRNSAGHRVPRGLYIYRATITDDSSGEKSSTASRRLAVAAP